MSSTLWPKKTRHAGEKMKIIDKPRYSVIGQITPFDERDNVQARNTLVPGSKEYTAFYRRHPEWEKKDQEIRELPGMSGVGNPLDLPFLGQQMENLIRYSSMVDGPVSPHRLELSAERATTKIKGFAHHLGADLVRIGPLNPAHVYTHIGKTWHDPVRKYGEPIDLDHKNAVSIAVRINPYLIKTGPVLSEVIEIMRAYVRAATIAVTVAGYIRAVGYPARAHIITNYQVLCVPLAIDAGMGELGRHGLMITKELGSCLKLATVTTDLPLAHDPPVDIGVDEFCQDCKICAESCPSGAIPYGEKKVTRGVEKWRISPEACFTVWNETGTDCGVCVASCPWTKPRTWFHDVARGFATRKFKAGLWMSYSEKLFYGKFKPHPVPSWLEEPEPIWRKYKKLL
jgi:ferredoxin